MSVGKFLVPISVTLGQGHQALEAGQILPCPQDSHQATEVGQILPCPHDIFAHPIATKLKRYPLVMLSSWLNFGEILCEFFF